MSSATTFGSNSRTIIASAIVLSVLAFSFLPTRLIVYDNVYDLFMWSETTWFGVIGKTWGAAFAIVEAVHLLAMALLGGTVFVSDFRLLGWGFKDVPAQEVLDKTHAVFKWALAVVVFTGIFMACGVAGKIYYMAVFWYKMLALATGILFVFFVKRPLLKKNFDDINPWVIKLVAISSMMVWVTVAAAGRWIGFTG